MKKMSEPTLNTIQNVKIKSLFLIGKAPMRLINKKFYIERQASEGLKRWAENFDFVIWASSLIPENIAKVMDSIDWKMVDEIQIKNPIKIVPLPWVFNWKFFKLRKQIRANLRRYILSSTYLHFAIASWNGCWGRQAAFEANFLKKPYSIHLETVAYSTAWNSTTSLKSKFRFILEIPLIWYSDYYLLKKAKVVQCNGMDTFNFYSKFSKHPTLIHNIHTEECDLINKEKLSKKLQKINSFKPLQICYLGKIVSLKGPIDWVKTLYTAKQNGAIFNATWMGSGIMKNELKNAIKKMGMTDFIDIIPFEKDRVKVRNYLQSSDLFLFTHLSLESSRVQKEALNQGTPIIGYHTAFAEEIVKNYGGGEFSPMGDSICLGHLISSLYNNRERLSDLTIKAALDGRRFTSKKVFQDRAQKIFEAF